MKEKSLRSCFAFCGLMALLLFSSCSGEKNGLLLAPDSKVESILTYEWSSKQDKDTTWLICNQTVRFEVAEGSREVKAQATVKLWPEKEIVTFGAEQNPQPTLASENSAVREDGTLPAVKTITKSFYFDDGQTVKAVIHDEHYAYLGSTLPYVEISDIRFDEATAEAADDPNAFNATATFTAVWSEKVSDSDENGEESLSTVYRKIQSEEKDELLDTVYQTNYIWDRNNIVLIVEKTEIWSISGVKKQEFTSPSLPFTLKAKEDKSLETGNFDFKGTLSSARGTMEDLSVKGWKISRSMMVKTFTFDNQSDQFRDVFEYPLYTAQFTQNGKTVDFDLNVDFRHSQQTTMESDDKARHMTTATAVILNEPFTQTVTTSLSLTKDEPTPDPEPEPDPEPDPSKSYGKIISFNVSAVFDPSEIHKNGNITKKCVIIRYEKGYEWGVCAYEENFPASFSFANSGYTGFNSAAMDTAASPFQPARVENKADGIYWYAENNKLLAGIDIITCKTYGWKNIVDGKYTHVINGYKAQYSQDHYTMSLTAPDGTVMQFASSALK